MSQSGASTRTSLSIGEVLAELRPQFPDTTISKLRFLESEGLVEPERTPAGYRKYSREDVARLRYVLTAQRDHYLPLRVIREQLDAIDRGVRAVEPTPGRSADVRPLLPTNALPTSADFAPAETQVRLTRAELLERAEIEPSVLRQLEQMGLLAPGVGGFYDADALVIARTVVRMAAFGLEPRHLRPYRTAAEREIGLFEQVITPLARQRGADAKARAAEAARELAALSVRLHAALVQAGLRATLG